MKRGVVLSLLLAAGCLCVTVSGFRAPPAGPTPAGLAATKIEKVKDNLYVIIGSGVADQTNSSPAPERTSRPHTTN
jgi:hypothetical protein